MNTLKSENFFIPISNLFFDEALKQLKPKEFKTYIGITYLVKKIGPNQKEYYSSKCEIFKNLQDILKISYQTFLRHLKRLEEIGVLEQLGPKAFSICYGITESKQSGFTKIDLEDLEAIVEALDPNEIKLFMALYRLLNGFNLSTGSYSYAQLKKWSGIKNKAIFISSRNSLVQKGMISALMDLNTLRYTFKLKSISNSKSKSAETKKKLHQVEKKQHLSGGPKEKKLHIKSSNPNKNKYIKKSLANSNCYKQKAIQFETENRKKIFLFLSEHIKTKHLSMDEKESILQSLVEDVEKNGGFQGVKVKSNPLYYLAQEHSQYGRNLDKILDRYFHKAEQSKRDNESRKLFLNALKTNFRKESIGLDDFLNNEISRFKLDKLIKNSPGIGYFSNEFLFKEIKTPNPEFCPESELKSSRYLEELIQMEAGKRSLEFDERLELINKFLPEVSKKFPVGPEFIFKKIRLSFEEFCQKYNEAYKNQRLLESELIEKVGSK